jgi:rare lipoprotein A
VSGACLLLASGACVIILAGCASPRQAGRSQTAPVPPTAETPQQPSTAEFVTQTGDKREGMASWYGREFHGKPTASGEPYNMFALTCAHREYPLGTKLRVVHLANGQDVECIVNDRGPFVSNRSGRVCRASRCSNSDAIHDM